MKGCVMFGVSKTDKHLQLCERARYRATRTNLREQTAAGRTHSMRFRVRFTLLLYKILNLLFSPLYEFSVRYALRVKKKTISKWSWCVTFGISVPSAERLSHQPITELCRFFFGVTDKTPGLIFRNNCVNILFVSIGHRDSILARYESIFPFLRCQGVLKRNVHATFSFPNPLP